MRKKDVIKKGKASKKNIDFVSWKMFCSDVIFLKAIRKGFPQLSFILGTTYALICLLNKRSTVLYMIQTVFELVRKSYIYLICLPLESDLYLTWYALLKFIITILEIPQSRKCYNLLLLIFLLNRVQHFI